MLKQYEASGKTLDDALDAVSVLAGRSLDELNIEVLNMPSKGLFGIGQKDARVRATFEAPDLPSAPAAEGQGSTFGRKKSKREKAESKAEKKAADFDLKPIVTIDPSQVAPESLAREIQLENSRNQQNRAAQPPQERSERSERPRRDDRRRGERREDRREDRPRGERREGERRNDRPREERKPRPESRRRDSHALEVTEGAMAQELTAKAMDFLTPIFNAMGVEAQPQASVREGILWLSFSGEKLGLLIGRRGETLNALQYLTNLAVNKGGSDHARLVLDVSDYRSGREETLSSMAHKMADKAVRSGRKVELEPMNPHERRVVHIALQDDRRVDTVSHGEEPYRRVVITSKQRRRRSGNGGGSGAGNNHQPHPQADGELIAPLSAPPMEQALPNNDPAQDDIREHLFSSRAAHTSRPAPEAAPAPQPAPQPASDQTSANNDTIYDLLSGEDA